MDDAEAQRVRRGYYAAVSFTDSLVGRLLGELKELGLENNTIISFHADHGWQLGEVRTTLCKLFNHGVFQAVHGLCCRACAVAQQRCGQHRASKGSKGTYDL